MKGLTFTLHHPKMNHQKLLINGMRWEMGELGFTTRQILIPQGTKLSIRNSHLEIRLSEDMEKLLAGKYVHFPKIIDSVTGEWVADLDLGEGKKAEELKLKIAEIPFMFTAILVP